jgi:PAS domain S-box-containing protein
MFRLLSASKRQSTDAERAQRLADLLMLSHEAVLVWTLDGPIEFWNAGAERLYGFSADEAVGHASHDLLRTKFPIEVAELRSQLRNKGDWPGELSHICKDGHEVVVESRQQLLRDDTVIEVNRDVTVIKQIEAALREHQEGLNWLASIVESSDDAIVSKDLDGIITSWNRGAERIFGYTAEEAIGQPVTIVIPRDRQNEERTILTRVRRGERIDHFETLRQHKNGNLIVVSLTVSPVKGPDGKVVGASMVARDITEQKRSQDLISTLAREAEHRSKNLLATVQAAVRLSHADTPEGLKKAVDGRIQALANVHSTLAKTRWIGADLSAIAAQELAPYAEASEQRVRIVGPSVLLDANTAQTIAVALHELATNAAKYGALSVANGHVTVNWSDETNGELYFRWSEMGGPKVQEPTRKGFGRRIIEQMIGQHSGKASFDWRAEGLLCEIILRV